MEHYVDSPSSFSLFFLKMEQILKVFIQPAKYCVITQCPPYFCCFLEIASIFCVIPLLHNIPHHNKSISKRTSHSFGNSTSNLLKYYDAITALTFSILINAIQHLFSPQSCIFTLLSSIPLSFQISFLLCVCHTITFFLLLLLHSPFFFLCMSNPLQILNQRRRKRAYCKSSVP